MISVFSKSIVSPLVMLLGCVVWLPSAMAQDVPDEPIEILETIEVPATVVIQDEKPISIPKPDTTTFLPLNGLIAADIHKTHTISQVSPKIVRDAIADRKGLRKPVRLIKGERPLYPLVARKEGREGTVVLRLTVNREGRAEKVQTQKSSGFPSLDKSAMLAVKTWRFAPAKDGEFPILVTVDLPIRFNLEEYKER